MTVSLRCVRCKAPRSRHTGTTEVGGIRLFPAEVYEFGGGFDSSYLKAVVQAMDFRVEERAFFAGREGVSGPLRVDLR